MVQINYMLKVADAKAGAIRKALKAVDIEVVSLVEVFRENVSPVASDAFAVEAADGSTDAAPGAVDSPTVTPTADPAIRPAATTDRGTPSPPASTDVPPTPG